MIQYIKFGQNPSFGSRDRLQTSLFGQNFTFKVLVWPWKWGQGHQNLITSFPCPIDVSVCLVKIHQLAQEIVCRQGSFLIIIVWQPWKFGQGHQNLINSFNYPNNTIHIVWPESIIWFKRYCAENFFCSKFDIQSAGVTLKMIPRSSKSNHFFPMSQLCFCVSLVKIHHLVQETECRKGSFLQSL